MNTHGAQLLEHSRTRNRIIIPILPGNIDDVVNTYVENKDKLPNASKQYVAESNGNIYELEYNKDTLTKLVWKDIKTNNVYPFDIDNPLQVVIESQPYTLIENKE
jgi:hypothetical protein